MKKQIISSILIFGMLFVISCKTQKKATTEEACATPAPSYSTSVKSIVESKCSVDGCHSRGRGDFRVYENFKREADEGSLKQKAIVQKSMPPSGPLPAEEIKLIDCWLKGGAKEN